MFVFSAFVCVAASQLLGYILDLASSRLDIKYAALHALASDKETISFYMKRGFKLIKQIDNHYPGIEPPHAVYMQAPLPWLFAGAAEIYKSSFDPTLHNISP